ncbi:uncharacterized protein LOC110066330 isoform X2 [Orbicella faveolata]|uniref:uncharacterized protein LOC110066330 isoform X2 n=1 Tax=Orbicella faveolata TaxID=48498 RepID=UPI0009E494F7|nr:uncharacterized protein LOC110066330 isoform X2 [Orbicella faveolata]
MFILRTMSFICCETPSRKRQCTSGKILLTILVFLTFSSVSKGYKCPNCSGQYIKTIDPSTGKCVECWPCPECLDGHGSSVKCGATVPEGTKIHCVLCVNGANFSDSFGTDQCQPCGECAGEHEHVLNKCTCESDVKCDCKAGFYWNKTNDKCLPCSSCPSCLGDKDIFAKCQKDKGEQQMARSSIITYSTSSVSSLVTSSHSHYATSMSLFPTRTRQMSATSTSVLEHEMTTPTSKATVPVQMNDDHTHKSSSKKTEIIISVSIIMCVCLSTCVTLCLLYHTLKNSRTRRINNDPVRFSELNKGTIEESQQGNNEESCNSCETSCVDELNMDKTQCSEIVEERNSSEPVLSSSLRGSEDKSNLTADSVHQDGRAIVGDQIPEDTTATGIPSSLEDEQKNEQRNCICQGHNQPCDLPKDVQDGSVIASKDGTVVPSDNLDALVDVKNKMPSGNNTAVNVVINIHDLSQIMKGTASVSPFGDLNSTSCDNNLVVPASSSGMPVPVNQGTMCAPSSTVTPTAQSTEGNRGYATHITCVPSLVINEMCTLLDLDRYLIDGNDYTRLGSELGLNSTQIQTLKQKCNNPSYVILMQVFSVLPNSGTLEHLIPLLKKMGRHDVIQVIDRWVGSQ